MAPAPADHARGGKVSLESILLVEDKAELRVMLVHALRRMSFDVTEAAGVEQAIGALGRQRFSVVLTDLKLPSGSGMDVLRAAMEADPATPVVLMTAYGTIAQAVEAMREGAHDFIQKPIDLSYLEHLLHRAIERQQLLRENIVLREEYSQRYGFPRIVGEDPGLREAARQMQRIAGSDSTVLLLGESGTGKELFARAIHQLSPRAQRTLLTLNCAAIPESLLENELFGHERGAFTGADARRPGKFELAHGGTIFLDEIAELPLSSQAKLLRVLEERVVERLGGTTPIHADVRVIAATNRDLAAAVEQGLFRRDLYFRLAVFPITVPPLRQRQGDIPALARHFLERYRRELRKPRLSLSPDAIAVLQDYGWPGNVRELQNLIERMAILKDAEIGVDDLNLPVAPRKEEAEVFTVQKDNERHRIELALRRCKWNKTAAAQQLGISYKTLLNKLKAYELD